MGHVGQAGWVRRYNSPCLQGQNRAVRQPLLFALKKGCEMTKPLGECRFVPWLKQGHATARVGNYLKPKCKSGLLMWFSPWGDGGFDISKPEKSHNPSQGHP